MKLVLIGIQGSGKSTQGNLLSAKLKIPYLSTGHIFRQIAKEKTPLGRYIKDTINAGVLIPDKETIEIVNEYLSRDEYKNGYILDGFPRTIEQAKKFCNNVDFVIYLNVPDQEALWRIAARNDTSREDETLIAIKKRIALFHEKTTPVIEYYRKKDKLFEVNGVKSIEEIHKKVMSFVEKLYGGREFKNLKELQKKRPPVILGVVGLAGSGKTETCNFFRQKGLPVIAFGDIINEYIDQHQLTHNEETHKNLRAEFREKHGLECMAKLNESKIRQALKKSPVVIIESLYTWEEYLYLKQVFNQAKILLLALFAEKATRYERTAKRKYRQGLGGEERDINELTKMNKAQPIAFADYTVLNRDSLAELYEKLEGIYRKIYYGMF
jgi:adenylate kinase